MSRRSKPPNRFGCKPDEDVCVAHDLPLECRHGCENASKHDCKTPEEHAPQWYSTIPPARLRCIIKNGCALARREHQRDLLWALVSHLFGVGSTSAAEICRLADLDPDQQVRRADRGAA